MRAFWFFSPFQTFIYFVFIGIRYSLISLFFLFRIFARCIIWSLASIFLFQSRPFQCSFLFRTSCGWLRTKNRWRNECGRVKKKLHLLDAVRAEGGTRTHMTVKSHAPETCVSTSFTTSACRFERETRLEPATYSLEGCRSTNWATPAKMVMMRFRADSNRCTRFCRPLPSHSATEPFV